MEEPQLMYPMPLAPERGAAISTNDDTQIDLETPILIVGGGPVGMLQALIFSRVHNQACTMIERELTTTIYPKMEYTNGRSMEIYRMMGLAEELRAFATAEVAEKYSGDELVVTSLAKGGKLIHIWERDSPEVQRKKSKTINDGSQYLEPHMRCHQILIEKWLKEKVEADENVQSHWGTFFQGFDERDNYVLSKVKKSDGTVLHIKSKYVIGCDGGGSWVRKSAGLESKREYLNLTMAFVHFRSATLRKAIPFPRFWHASVIGGGILVSQNENDLWTGHLIMPPGVDPTSFSTDQILALAIGGCQGPIPVTYDEIYCRGIWKVEVAIANRFRSDKGRIFLAGDAAHQLSPIGGHGLNSGLGDAFDLAWKLAATLKGWGSDKLLSTYDTERRQIAFENLGHVQKGLETIIKPIMTSQLIYGPEVVNGEGERAEQVRAELIEKCKEGHWLHDQNGNILGYSYKKSPIIIETQENTPRPTQTDEDYVPTTFPGSQAPHVWMKDGRSTIDQFDPTAFSIVDFSDGSLSRPFVEAANALGIPLQTLMWHNEENVRKVYERDLVLVRLDTHVCWRCPEGTAKPSSVEEATSILSMVAGR